MQGSRLFHKAELGKEALRIPCEAAYCGSDFSDFGFSEPVQRQVSEGRQVLRSVAAKNRAAIFVEGGIADMMHAVFDGAPVTSHQFQNPRRIGATTQE